MKGKKLSSEDLKLWDKVTGSTKPLDKKKPVVHDTPPKKNNLRSVIKPQRVSPKIKTLSQSANEPFQKKSDFRELTKSKNGHEGIYKAKKR